MASTSTQLPHDVRADEVIDAMRVTPRQLLRQADWLHPLENPDSMVRAQVLASPQVATGHADHSADAGFLQRARPVGVQSIGYFDWTRLRGFAGIGAIVGRLAWHIERRLRLEGCAGGSVKGGRAAGAPRAASTHCLPWPIQMIPPSSMIGCGRPWIRSVEFLN
ncbi:MAG: hypothetical protein IPP90_21015 [Gemmatimonadaceae bacterium]|nr:hypothetical protein [Gemmatimonadaceae bacterium]